MIKKMMLGFCMFLCVLLIGLQVYAGSVPDTGQTQSYTDTFGEDSDYTINPPSYTKLDSSGNPLADSASSWAMVRDNVTGLIWEVKKEGEGIHYKDNKYKWQEAQDVFIAALNSSPGFGGYTDWRLPTIKELAYLVNYGIPYPGPCIYTTYFPNTMPLDYWSSTTCANSTAEAWDINFNYGNDNTSDKLKYELYVRAVRGVQSPNNFVDNGNGTVTDKTTGLMWQQATATGTYKWDQALDYCETLSLGGRTDWRLPNIKELRSLVDYSTYDPAVNTIFSPDTNSSNYWSSTTGADDTGRAWRINFNNGNDSCSSKSNDDYVRAVRGGLGPLAMPWIPLLMLGN